MTKLSDQLAALLIDVQTMEDDNVRLNSALAKSNAEMFELRKNIVRGDGQTFKHVASVKDGIAQVVSTGRTVTLKIPSGLNVMEFKPKDGTFEDDVRKFLGLEPYTKSGFKNDKKFLTKIDKAYGAAQVDAMIKQLRGA